MSLTTGVLKVGMESGQIQAWQGGILGNLVSGNHPSMQPPKY